METTVPELIVPKEWFEIWRSPREFFRKTDECMGQFEPDEILSMTGVQHLFDAYVAGLFARIRETSHGTENTATYKRDYDLFHIPPPDFRAEIPNRLFSQADRPVYRGAAY